MLTAWAHSTCKLTDPMCLGLSKALASCFLLSLSSGPLGVFLVLRRMTLIGDALSHGILPGVALAFLLWGPAPVGMNIMGMGAGLMLACLSTGLSHAAKLNEESTFAGLYLLSLSVGVLLLAHHQDELLHMLFGSLATLSQESIWTIGGISIVTLIFLFQYYQPLVIQCFDPDFFEYRGGNSRTLKILFMLVLSMNLVASFQALGTLMALGLLILPALIMRLLSNNLRIMCIGSSILGISASAIGLLWARQTPHLWGATIVAILGFFYLGALIYASWSKT